LFSTGNLTERLSYVQYAIRELFPVAEKIEKAGQTVARVNVGDPVPYFGTPKYITEALCKAAKDGKTGYGRSPGEQPFLDAIARRYKRKYNFEIETQNIFVTQGVSEAIQFIDAALMEKGRGCVVFSPYYSAYMPTLKFYGGAPYASPCLEEKGWAPDIDDLQRQVRKAKEEGNDLRYVRVINPSNPAGSVWERKDLQAVADFAKDNDLLLVSDELYDEIVFDGEFTSMAELVQGQPFVLLNGMSKNWCATGLRLGWIAMHGKGEAMAKLHDGITRLGTIRLCPSMPAQFASVEALDNVKAHQEFLAGFNKEVKRRSDHACKLLNEIPGVSCQRAKGAFYLFPKIDVAKAGCKTDTEFVRKLLETQHVWAVQGTGFGCSGHLRIVTLPDMGVLDAACAGIAKMMGAK